MERLGQWLKSAREAKGISLIDVEQKTRLRAKALVAIEDGDKANLPPRTYVKGIVRNYAQFLGLDPDKALSLLDDELGTESDYLIHRVAVPINRYSPVNGRAIATFLSLVVVAALFIFGYQNYARFIESDALSPPLPPPPQLVAASEISETGFTPTPVPTATFVPSPTATPLSQITIETRITERSYLRVTADNQVIYEAIPSAGETMIFTATEKIVLRAGNAVGVEVSFNGRNQGVMGSRGEVIERTWTRP